MLQAAVADAVAADDPTLVEWARRREARGLLAAGDRPEALALYETLWASSPTASEIAFECARSLHADGALAPALDWYRRALGRGGAQGYGRNKFEVLQGILFILAEQRRFAEAVAELDRYDATYPNQQVRAERAFLAWRAGEAPTVASFPAAPPNQDLHRYWLLELRLLNGEDPRLLLADARRPSAPSSRATSRSSRASKASSSRVSARAPPPGPTSSRPSARPASRPARSRTTEFTSPSSKTAWPP